MYLPALPTIQDEFASSPQAIQLSLSLFLYGNALGHLVFGPLSDRFGRKPVLLSGLAAYFLASLGCATAASITEFQLFRFLQGVASASGPVLVRALLNDRLERIAAARMLALLTACMALAAMLTPVIGGVLTQHYAWTWIFYALAGLALILLVVSLIVVEESLPIDNRIKTLRLQSIAAVYGSIIGNRRFWSYVLPPTLMFAGVFAYAAVNSFLLIDELAMAEQTHGLWYAVAAFAFVSGSLTSNRLVQTVGIDRAFVIGLSFGVISSFSAIVASITLPLSLGLVLIPGICTFFSTALILPIAFAIAVSLFPHQRGSASAVAGFTQLVFAGLGAACAASWYDGHTLNLHIFTFACCVVAAVIWWIGATVREPL